ncbi:MAG: hypothetical protein [Arizlama microvirus]|nr:MAG: hypothetical protein [Arizlama microvirus]
MKKLFKMAFKRHRRSSRSRRGRKGGTRKHGTYFVSRGGIRL